MIGCFSGFVQHTAKKNGFENEEDADNKSGTVSTRRAPRLMHRYFFAFLGRNVPIDLVQNSICDC